MVTYTYVAQVPPTPCHVDHLHPRVHRALVSVSEETQGTGQSSPRGRRVHMDRTSLQEGKGQAHHSKGGELINKFLTSDSKTIAFSDFNL